MHGNNEKGDGKIVRGTIIFDDIRTQNTSKFKNISSF